MEHSDPNWSIATTLFYPAGALRLIGWSIATGAFRQMGRSWLGWFSPNSPNGLMQEFVVKFFSTISLVRMNLCQKCYLSQRHFTNLEPVFTILIHMDSVTFFIHNQSCLGLSLGCLSLNYVTCTSSELWLSKVVKHQYRTS